MFSHFMICLSCLDPAEPLPEEEEDGQWGWWTDHELSINDPYCPECDAKLVKLTEVELKG